MSAGRRSSIGSLDVGSDSGEMENDLRNYTSRMEELFEDSEGSDQNGGEGESDDDEGFLYAGVDAGVAGEGYRDKLRDVLGPELSDDSDEENLSKRVHTYQDRTEQEPLPLASPQIREQEDIQDDPVQEGESAIDHHPALLSRSSVDPSVSRLRSHQLYGQSPHTENTSSGEPPISPAVSVSELRKTADHHETLQQSQTLNNTLVNLEPFKWSELKSISDVVTKTLSQKLSAVLGAPLIGTPTVLTANGLICIGTDAAKICVFDFRQNLKAICGKDTPFKEIGAVTALALSYDQAFVASGHASGHIQVFDLKKPNAPIYTAAPTTLAIVASGRKEGHLEGSRIRRIGFITGKRTVIVTSDDQGLAFTHRFGKVLFIEASDILRILGKYPFAEEGDAPVRTPSRSLPTNSPQGLDTSIRRRRKHVFPILDMAPLPLGTMPCATDQYNLIALLTATKLVVVGLRPSPRTWFKCVKDPQSTLGRSKLSGSGTLAWFPCMSEGSQSGSSMTQIAAPLLAYTWGNQVYLIRLREHRVKQTLQDPRSGKIREIEVGTIVYENVIQWTTDDEIHSMQWLNGSQILLVMPSSLKVYDPFCGKLVESIYFDPSQLVTPSSAGALASSVPFVSQSLDVAHSVHSFKGKIFLLEKNHVRVGTLLTWADKILSLVETGDFLAAIEVARSYYDGTAKGNMHTLPSDPDALKTLVGEKIRNLMFASTRYAFSEERMIDGTLASLDGRGVDKTEFFEQLVTVCAKACTSINDFEFLFEDLFQQYDEVGIVGIYLQQIDRHMLDDTLRHVPPHITQQVLESQKDNPAHIEHLICRIDPACLDINQSIRICQDHFLYDALIYVYTSALHDYTAPIVELLDLIKRLRSTRKGHAIGEEKRDRYVRSATKIFPYLAAILTGRTHPNGDQLTQDDALQAQADVYGFLFSGRTAVWPPGEGAKVILTSDEGGPEPTYPYIRQLLHFDTEAFLHTLDIAFEDTHLNDESQGTSRLLIVRVLLEILSSQQLPPHDSTLVNIFIARNVPKYPQFIQVAPSALKAILIDLVRDGEEASREDRQLAAEYLLSVYTPDDHEELSTLFHSAGFYRILRRWHSHEKRWAALAGTYLEDDSLTAAEKLQNLNQVLASSSKHDKGALPNDLLDFVSESLPQLLQTSIVDTAILIEKYAPQLHEKAVDDLSHDSLGQLDYLQCLLLKSTREAKGNIDLPPQWKINIPETLRKLFVELQCRHSAEQLIPALEQLSIDFLDPNVIARLCEDNKLFYASVWVISRAGQTESALNKVDSYSRNLVADLLDAISQENASLNADIQQYITSLERIAGTGIQTCVNQSRTRRENSEDDWFRLLSTEMTCVQTFSASTQGINGPAGESSDVQTARDYALKSLRGLVEQTFAAMTNNSPMEAAILPSLFVRLVESTPAATGTQYSELRMVLDTILDSFRWDADMLSTVKQLVHQDLFQAIADVATERNKGWTTSRATCSTCRHPLLDESGGGVVVSRTGSVHHKVCPVN